MEFSNILACTRSVPEGAKRFIKINAAGADPILDYFTRTISIVQIDNASIVEFDICVKDANGKATDSQLLNNLKNNYYRIADKLELSLSGIHIDYTSTTSTTTLQTNAQGTTNITYMSDKKYLI